MSNNTNLNKATVAKNDEFYTLLSDVEKELQNYGSMFKDQIVYCNCDRYPDSNFIKYFYDNFHRLKLKQLIATCYASKSDVSSVDAKSKRKHAMYMSYNGKGRVKTKRLKGDGSYDGSECVDVLERADLVATNPPFSKLTRFIPFLVENNKKFIVLGNLNAVSVKSVFELLMKNKVRIGYSVGNTKFEIPSNDCIRRYKSFGNIVWLTNLKISKRHKNLILTKKYNKDDYQFYDSYPQCININKLIDIPVDWSGPMGVPISVLTKFDPKKFNILGLDAYISGNSDPGNRFKINGRKIYARIVIEHRKDNLRTQK